MQPVVVAHRGASAHRAEHTLAAYALALDQGAGGVECDVRLSRDGHLVCVHDRRVDRTSTGRGLVSELTLERLSELDFGGWHDELPESADALMFNAAAPAQRHKLLTFEALLGMVRDTNPAATVFVETKHPVRYGALVEAKLVATLARHGLAKPPSKMDSPVVVMSFSGRAMRRVRDYAPLLPTVLLTDTVNPLRRDGSLPPWADLAGPGIRLLRADPHYVTRCARRGNPVYCWTVDTPADVALCHGLGVRYVATNRPAATRALLDTLG